MEKTTKVLTLDVTPEILSRMPPEERAWFFTVGHIANELAILRKLILISDNTNGVSNIEVSAQVIQTLLFIKIFSLKAVAGFEFLQKCSSQPGFLKYAKGQGSEITKHLRKLRKYFKGESRLEFVRNKFGAHYDTDHINFQDLAERDGDLKLFVAEQQGNTVYYAAEEILFTGLQMKGDSTDDQGSVIGKLIDDIHEVASLVLDCAQDMMIVVGSLYANDSWKASGPANSGVTSIPMADARNIKLPYFIDFEVLLKG